MAAPAIAMMDDAVLVAEISGFLVPSRGLPPLFAGAALTGWSVRCIASRERARSF